MKRTLSRKSITAFLAMAMLIAVLLNNATRSVQPSLIERSAVINADHAALHVMPSGYTATIGVCFKGQRLTVWKPGIFGFHRARCNEVVGWILSEQITVKDHEPA